MGKKRDDEDFPSLEELQAQQGGDEDFPSLDELKKVKKKDQSSPASSTPYHLQPSTSGKPISPAQNFDAYLKDELNHFPGIPAPTPQPQQRQPLDPSLRGDLYSTKEAVITAGVDPKKAPVTGKDLTMKEANEISKKIGQATIQMQKDQTALISGQKKWDDILVKNKSVPFVDRMLNPEKYPTLSNDDGTESTHRMASGEADGKFVVFPTLFVENGKVIEPEDPFDYAMKKKDVIFFNSKSDAEQFAEGAWKKSGLINKSAPKEPEPAVDIEMLKKVNPQFKEDWEKQQKDTKINEYMLIQAANDPEKIDDWAAKKKAGLSQEEEYRILSEINLADIENKKQDDEILKARLTEIEAEGSLGQSQGELVKIRDGIKALQPDLEKQKVTVGKFKTQIDRANQEIQPYVETIQKLAPVIKELNDRAVSEGERINAFEKMGPMTPTQIAEYKATIDNYNKIVTEIQSHKEYFEAEGKIKELQAKNAPLFDSYSKAVDKLNGTLDQVNQAGDQYNQILEEMDKNGYMEQYSKTFAELEENSAGYEKVAAEQNALIKKYPEVYKKQMDQDVANLMYEVAKHQGGAKFSDALMQESVKRAYNFTVNGVASALIALNHTVERPIATALGIGKTDAAMNAINTVVDNLIVTVPDKKIYNGETGEIDPWRIIPYAAEQAANIYMLVQGGGLLGGGTKGLVTTAYLTQYESVRKEAVAAGLSNNDAIMYAMPVAAGMALLEVIMPDSNLVFGSKKMLAEFAKNVGKNRNLAFKSVMDQLKKVLMENVEEFSQSAYQKFANVATNQMMGTKMETQINTEEIINTAFITTPVSFFAGVGNIRLSHNREMNYQVAQLAMNPDLTAKAIQENVDAGILTPEEAEGLQEKVKKYEEIVAGMPPNLSTEKKVQVAPIIEEINDLEAEKEGLSEQFAKLKEEEIKAKEKEFKAAMGVTEAKPQGADNTDGLSEERTAQEESTPVEVGVKSDSTELKIPSNQGAIEKAFLDKMGISMDEYNKLDDAGKVKALKAVADKETKQETPPVAKKVPAPAPVNTGPTQDGKKNRKGKDREKIGSTTETETASSEAVSPALKDVESTAKAIKSKTNNKDEDADVIEDLYLRENGRYKMFFTKIGDALFFKSKGLTGKETKEQLISKGIDTAKLNDERNVFLRENEHNILSEAYHKAKADGSNPDLIEAIDGVLVSSPQKPEAQLTQKQAESPVKPAPTSATMTQAEKDKNNAEAEKLGWTNVPQALKSIEKRTGTKYAAWEDVPAEVREKVSKEREAEVAANKKISKLMPGLSGEAQLEKEILSDETILTPNKEKTPPAKSKIEAAKERMKAAKAKLNKGKLGIANDPKQQAKDLFEYHASLVEVAKEYIKEGVKTGKEFAAKIEEKFTKKIKDAWIEAKGGPAKTEDDFLPPPPGEKSEAKEKGPERKKRRFTKQIQKSKDIPDSLKEYITDDQIFYNKLPNATTLEEANSIIDYLGEDRAALAYFDMSNGMSDAVRNTVGQVLLKRLSAMGEHDTAISILDSLVKRGTEMGQGIQALSMFGQLTPEGQLREAQRNVNKQAETRAKRDKPKTDKIIKGMKKVNKETVDEVLEKPEIKKKIAKVMGVAPKPSTQAGYGATNKVVTKQRYNELLAKVKGKLFSNPFDPVVIEIAAYHLEASGRKFGDFTKNMIRDFGSKVKPHLKAIYDAAKEKLKGEYTDFDSDSSVNEAAAKLNTDHLVKAMEKAIARGNKKEMDKALAALQKVSKDEGLWGKYKAMAVQRLKTIAMKDLASDIKTVPLLEEFTNGLVKNISQQIPAEQGPVPAKKKPKPAIEIIADAFKNFEKYADAWTDTMEAIKEEYKENPELLEELDAYFGEILAKPFSEKLVQEAVKTGMKDLGQNLEEIVKSHYTVYDVAKENLRHKLMNQAGLTEEEATELADAIRTEFDRIATIKKQQILNRMFSTKERAKPEVKTLEGEIIKLTNLGAFADPVILQQYAEKMGYPKLTQANIDKIIDLGTKIQKAPDGIKKFRAIEDLLTYQAKIQGMSAWDTALAVWYANILSGHQTQITNSVANAFNTAQLFLNASVQNPTNSLFMAKGLFNGLMRGLIEGKEVLRTGYNPIRENKVEVPPVLEWKRFMGGNFNPGNYLKYVRRLMVAADTVFFEGLKELRAYQLAAKEAAAEGKLEPTLNQRNRALEKLNKTDTAIEYAKSKAEKEYSKDAGEINNDPTLTDAQKAEKLAQAKRDIRRRVYEILEKSRGSEIVKESHSFAARGTYNYKPEGALGYIAQALNFAGQKVTPIKLIIPFTNIIANVANETINYTPWGFVRGNVRGSLTEYLLNKRVPGEMTDQEKVDAYTKAILGTSMMAALIALTLKAGDDDDKPMVEITANGYGNYRENYDLKDWQAYSIRIKNPVTGEYGPWISYRLTPLMLGFSFVGNMRDYEKYRKGKVTDKGFLTKMSIAAGQVVPTFLNMTFLSSLNTFLKAMSEVNSETVVDDLFKQMARTAKGFVMPNLITQTSKEVQDFMDIPEKEVGVAESGLPGIMESMLGEFIRDIPVARDMFYNKVNGLGEEVVTETSRIITNRESSPEWNLLRDKQATTSIPSIKTVKVFNSDYSQRFMNREEYYRFAKARGKLMKEQLTKNMKVLSKMTTEEFATEWTAIKKYATTEAKEMVVYPRYTPAPYTPAKRLTDEQKKARLIKEREKIKARTKSSG